MSPGTGDSPVLNLNEKLRVRLSERVSCDRREYAVKVPRLKHYVYFENSSSNPYLIRRIEELNKTANGNVEAKVVSLFRRRDISSNLNGLADSNAREFEEESKQPVVSEQQGHQLKHRELFLSRQFESLPATHIRGKCNVTLLNETDVLAGYLEREDCFFYSLVFDPVQKTLLADQGEIRVGSKYQAEIPDKLPEVESDTRNQLKLETKVWDPDNPLTDRQIDQFLVVARAVGTFARALDCSSSIRQPSLHMSAAAASRDITLFHAMDTLQKNGYDLAKAMSTLVPQGGPVLCRDEMEEWSASEAMLFEEALEKYGKDFNDIRQDFLPWKSLASIVQFYYMWKTTDRYIQQEAPPRGHMTRQEVQGLSPFTSSAGRAKLLAKNRQTFILQTTKLTRIARRVIRLPKAPKLPLKVRATVRPTLATIVKELGRPWLRSSRSWVGGGLQYSANGRPFTSGMRTTSQSVIKRQKVNPGDAPNPVVFVATKDTRALRKALTQAEMRRAARKPHLPVRVKVPVPARPLLVPAVPASTTEPIVLED
ncbi:UNVERIFIED_CONTAM: hypothetical protein FKN15_004326 [Acipenser sinensis]